MLAGGAPQEALSHLYRGPTTKSLGALKEDPTEEPTVVMEGNKDNGESKTILMEIGNEG